MKISSAFPSDYLKAADLQDQSVVVTMDRVMMEDIGSDRKPVLYFQNKEKGLVLNKTNANNISFAYGDDTDDWRGRQIELYPTLVDFQGRSTPAIRVRMPQRTQAQDTQAPPNHPGPQNGAPAGQGAAPDMSDSIPF